MARSTTLRPKALRPGDVVAVAALSGGLDAEEEAVLGRGVAELEALGFEVHVSPLVDPELGNAMIGHQPPNVPLPLGIRAELDADAATLSLLEPATA
jgi:muramoyltetrapeptide carboxypeptidase LdcA involved in peptidoglycan recycling